MKKVCVESKFFKYIFPWKKFFSLRTKICDPWRTVHVFQGNFNYLQKIEKIETLRAVLFKNNFDTNKKITHFQTTTVLFTPFNFWLIIKITLKDMYCPLRVTNSGSRWKNLHSTLHFFFKFNFIKIFYRTFSFYFYLHFGFLRSNSCFWKKFFS